MGTQRKFGRLLPAPENFVPPSLAAEIGAHGMNDARRDFLRKSFAAASAALASGSLLAADGDPAILQPQKHATSLGLPVAHAPYGQPSRHEASLQRRESPGLTRKRESSISFTPLQGLFGIITPNGLHFERHHAGWHDIDPAGHRLMINGLVASPKVYTIGELMRLPSVSRMHFIECGANSAMDWAGPAVPSVQYTHGMLSCCEFTGVPLSLLLEHCGIDAARAKWILAEGADGASLTRSIPIERALDDAIVAWGMNGEMLRPENGYPLRLVVPGVQGVCWVKWLRRLEVGDAPYATREESTQYLDLMPNGLQRQYSIIQECKSVITSPSGGQRLLDRGYYNITGLAWSGRGKIARVDVSIDGGRNWQQARLESPVLPKCLTRFNIDWAWDGKPYVLQSRATDETGHVQPKIGALRAMRGTRSVYHNNAIQSWQVSAAGEVANVQIS
ncbi:MAG: sulfite dehydrogenase [Burkholderiaceae bacterium]|nr:sulfite dehydrogenase [Burkholderiaceae bacterium]